MLQVIQHHSHHHNATVTQLEPTLGIQQLVHANHVKQLHQPIQQITPTIPTTPMDI